MFWAAANTADVLRVYRDFARDAPDELGTVIRFGTIPPIPAVPEELHWRPAVAINTCHAAPVDEGARVLRPLREHGTPLLDLISPKPYPAHQGGLDSTVPHGWHYYWKSTDLPELSDDLIDVFVDHAFSAESPRSYSVLFHLGGAVSRVEESATAYTGRTSPHNLNINGVWRPDEEETYAESETAWTRRFFDALEPHRAGVYVNFLDADDDTQRVREAYGTDTYRRLAEIKTEYDPHNVFHLNQNVEPTA